MLRTRLSLILVALLSLAAAAQTGPGSSCQGSGHPLLQAEVAGPSGPVWDCPDRVNPAWLTDTRFRLTAPKGTWTTFVLRAYVPAETQGGAHIRASYPWLAPTDPIDPGLLFLPWAGQPGIAVDLGFFWFMLLNGLFDPVYLIPSENAVRDWYVPVLDDGTPAPDNQRVWDARPLGWLADPNGHGIGPVMSAIWSGCLTDPRPLTGDSTQFNAEALAILAIQLQAPSPSAAQAFVDSPDFTLAVQEGLFVDLQAVSMISSDPGGVIPGTNDLNAPGLLGWPTFVPEGTFSNPVTVVVAVSLPAGCGGCGPTLSFPTNVLAGQLITFRSPGMLWPAALHFTGNTGTTVPAVPVHAAPTILNPLRRRALIPNGIASGTVYVTTGLLTTPYPFVTITTPTGSGGN